MSPRDEASIGPGFRAGFAAASLSCFQSRTRPTGQKHFMPKHPRPTLGDTITNLRRSIGRRHAIYGLIKNNLIKVRNVDNCCGNYGDPGC